MTNSSTVPGLPEGIKIVRYGKRTSGSFVLVDRGEGDPVIIQWGPSALSTDDKDFIIEPEEGYDFVPDPNSHSGAYIVTPRFKIPRGISLYCTITNAIQEKHLTEVFARLKHLYGISVSPIPSENKD